MNDIKKHPIQPVLVDDHSIMRFKSNEIVKHLLSHVQEHGHGGLNQLAMMEFTQDDHQQFAQLIGVSLSLFGDLDCVDDETYDCAYLMSKGMSEHEARTEMARIAKINDESSV